MVESRLSDEQWADLLSNRDPNPSHPYLGGMIASKNVDFEAQPGDCVYLDLPVYKLEDGKSELHGKIRLVRKIKSHMRIRQLVGNMQPDGTYYLAFGLKEVPEGVPA